MVWYDLKAKSFSISNEEFDFDKHKVELIYEGKIILLGGKKNQFDEKQLSWITMNVFWMYRIKKYEEDPEITQFDLREIFAALNQVRVKQIIEYRNNIIHNKNQ